MNNVVAFIGRDTNVSHYMKTATKAFCGVVASNPGQVFPVDNQSWKADCDTCRKARARATIKKINAH